MKQKSVMIKLDHGLEARPVAMLVQVASRHNSTVYLESEGKKVNAKSIMGMMSLRVVNGDQVVVVTEGTDEEAAANEIELYLEAQ